MCLILLAINQHPEYPLILAANRDEFYARPSSSLAWWPEERCLLGGRDLESGGSWLGMTATGQLAAVTNFREGDTNLPQRPSRGELVYNFLTQKQSDWNLWLHQHAEEYNGFNLLYGRWDQLNWFSNRKNKNQALGKGFYGICNALLDTPWPKVLRGKSLFEKLVGQEGFSTGELLTLLQDNQLATDDRLPDTGIGLEWEKRLSSIFIRSENYGTRASSVIRINRKRQVEFTERTWTPDLEFVDRQINFNLD